MNRVRIANGSEGEMETVSKEAVLKIVKSGSKLNDQIRIITKDIVKRIEQLPVYEGGERKW